MNQIKMIGIDHSKATVEYRELFSFTKAGAGHAMEALKDYTDHILYSTNSIEKIQMHVAEYFNITVEDLKSKKRSNNIAHPRAIAMYLSRILTDETYPRIGLEFGGKDHSTVIHAYEKVSNDLKTNKELEKVIQEIKSNII